MEFLHGVVDIAGCLAILLGLLWLGERAIRERRR